MRIEPGQVAVVTGAASGIGLGLSRALARRGLTVVMADVEPEDLAAAEDEVGRAGGTTWATVVDVTDPDAVAGLAAGTIDRFGRVDVVCNNAGVAGKHAPAWELDLLDWRWLLDVNVWGVIHGIKAFVPGLVAQGHGHVLNTASMAGLVTMPENAAYNATKHAVVTITETLAADLARHAPGVGATVLCPGPTRTRMYLEGSRWRPAALTPAAVVGRDPFLYDHDPATVLEVDELVAATLGAVEADRVHVAPNPGSRARAEARIAALLGDLEA